MYEVDVEVVGDWQRVADKAAFTARIRPFGITVPWFRRMLIAEHSPLRAVMLDIVVYVPYYVHVHLIRHHVWVQPYVTSQRPDNVRPVDYDRRSAPQDEMVGLCLYLNPQSLLSIAKERMCERADPETRAVVIGIKAAFEESDDPFLRALGQAMQPKCRWAGGYCKDPFRPCGKMLLLLDFWAGDNGTRARTQ